MPAKAPVCIFCGGSPLTREHVFGRAWIPRLFGSGRYDVGHDAKMNEVRSQRTYEAVDGEANAIVKCACEACNGGWMERLDSRAHPLIEPMVRGEATTLSTLHELRVVAAWVTKVAMCLASTVCVSRPTQTEGDRFRVGGHLPPGGYRIRIGAVNIDWPNLWMETFQLLQQKGAHPDDEAYSSTFHVGRVVFQVFAPSASVADEGEAARWEARTAELWPTFMQVRWSTAPALTSDELGQFSRTYVADEE